MIFINNNAFSYVFVLVLCLLITAICSVCRFGCLLACVLGLSFSDETYYLSHFLQFLSHCVLLCSGRALYQPCITCFIDVFVDDGDVCLCWYVAWRFRMEQYYYWMKCTHGAHRHTRERMFFNFSFSRSPPWRKLHCEFEISEVHKFELFFCSRLIGTHETKKVVSIADF